MLPYYEFEYEKSIGDRSKVKVLPYVIDFIRGEIWGINIEYLNVSQINKLYSFYKSYGDGNINAGHNFGKLLLEQHADIAKAIRHYKMIKIANI